MNPLSSPAGFRRVPLAHIDAVVASRLGPARVKGNAQPAVFNRQIAMYLAKRVGGWSTTRIGNYYHGRDHSTVCHAIRKVDALRTADPGIAVLVDSLTMALCPDREGGVHTSHPPIMTTTDKARPEWIEQLADAIVERLARLPCDKAVSAAELRGRDVGSCAAAFAQAATSGHMHLRDDSVA